LKKLLIACLLASLIFVPSFLQAVPMHWDHPEGAKYTSQDYPLPTADDPTNGFITVASATKTIVASVSTVIGPFTAGTNQVEVWAFDGDINYGPSTVSSTTYNAYIASGSSKTFSLATTTPAIYLIKRTAVATETCTAGFIAK